MGRAEREKGKRYEREVRDLFRAVPDYYAERTGWHQSGGHAQLTLHTAADVEVLHASARVPLHVEAKYGSHTSLTGAIKQATTDAREGDVPIVVHKLPRGESQVTMPWSSFARLLERIVWD